MSSLSYKKASEFIELISKQRDLYDPNSRYFKSKNKRAKIWEEIAIKCNKKRLTGNKCKILWNKLKRSYIHLKKTGSVVNKRSYAKSKIFKLMTFIEVGKKQGNEKKSQANENQQQNNNNVQPDNANQQQGNENHQQNNNIQQDNANQRQGNENQQQTKENRQQVTDTQQQSKENQQQSKENQQCCEDQQQNNEKNIGPKNKNEVKERQGNKTKFDPKTTDGLLIQNKSPVKCAASPSGHTLQNGMPSVQLNINGVEINLGSKSNEKTPQTFHENSPAPKPKPQFWPQGKQNEDKSMEDELHLFSTQVRTTLGNLPRELQIKAQNEVFRVLSKYKKLALSFKSVSESSSKNTD